jgi:pimeloyl-ACP methyl ester carboxylesterase
VLGDAIRDAPGLKEISDFASLVFANFRPRRDWLPVFSDAQLRKLAMPVLAIVGARDVLINSRDTKRRLEKYAAHAQVRLLPRTGHLIRGETKTVLNFLTG